jgi:hypothetical protein
MYPVWSVDKQLIIKKYGKIYVLVNDSNKPNIILTKKLEK